MEIELNQTFSASMIVDEKSTAQAYGSGLLAVFATPAMIAFIENTAHLALNKYLQEGQTSVGTEVCVKHLKATAVGKEVICNVVMTETDKRKVVFSVEVYEDNVLIGSGTHTRFIVDINRFLLNVYPDSSKLKN